MTQSEGNATNITQKTAHKDMKPYETDKEDSYASILSIFPATVQDIASLIRRNKTDEEINSALHRYNELKRQLKMETGTENKELHLNTSPFTKTRSNNMTLGKIIQKETYTDADTIEKSETNKVNYKATNECAKSINKKTEANSEPFKETPKRTYKVSNNIMHEGIRKVTSLQKNDNTNQSVTYEEKYATSRLRSTLNMKGIINADTIKGTENLKKETQNIDMIKIMPSDIRDVTNNNTDSQTMSKDTKASRYATYITYNNIQNKKQYMENTKRELVNTSTNNSNTRNAMKDTQETENDMQISSVFIDILNSKKKLRNKNLSIDNDKNDRNARERITKTNNNNMHNVMNTQHPKKKASYINTDIGKKAQYKNDKEPWKKMTGKNNYIQCTVKVLQNTKEITKTINVKNTIRYMIKNAKISNKEAQNTKTNMAKISKDDEIINKNVSRKNMEEHKKDRWAHKKKKQSKKLLNTTKYNISNVKI